MVGSILPAIDSNALVIYDDSNEYGRDLINFEDSINVTSNQILHDTAIYGNETDNGTGYYLLGVAGNKSIFKSLDGTDWSVLATLPTAEALLSLNVFNKTIFATSHGTNLPLKPGRLFRSVDGGANWTNPLNSTGDDFFKMAQGPDGYLYIGEYDTHYVHAHDLYMSNDTGVTWSPIFNSTEEIEIPTGCQVRHIHGIFVDSTNTIWFGTGDGDYARRIYKSSNHGEEWTLVQPTFQGYDGFISAVEVNGWVYFGMDKTGCGIWRTPAGNGTYWEDWDIGPIEAYEAVGGKYLAIWDLFYYDNILYSVRGTNGTYPSVFASIVGQPHWVALHRGTVLSQYSQSTNGVFSYNDQKFFFVHNEYLHTWKIPITSWRAVYHAIWGLPAGETSTLVELKENQSAFASFAQSPLYNAKIRFVGWNISNILSSSVWDKNPNFEVHSTTQTWKNKWYNGGTMPTRYNWSSEQSHSGKYSLQMNLTANMTGIWETYNVNTSLLTPGNNYTLSYWMKGDRSDISNAKYGCLLKCTFPDNSTKLYDYNVYTISDSWIQYIYSFKINESYSPTFDRMKMMFKLNNSADVAIKVYLDDVQLEEGVGATSFKNGTVKNTTNPSVLLNGVYYNYTGALHNGDVSDWYDVGDIDFVNMTANDQNFKIEIQSEIPSTISCDRSVVQIYDGIYRPISIRSEPMINVTGYLPTGREIERVGSICYRVDDARANISGINVTATGEVRMYLNDTNSWDLSAVVEDIDDSSVLVASWWAQLSGTSVSYSFGLKLNCLYRLLVDDVWFADNTSDSNGKCMFNYSGSSSGHTIKLCIMPIPISITSPTSDSTYSTNKSAIDLGGTADDDGGVTCVTWSNAATGASGTATGTTSWTVNGIVLSMGSNLITVMADNAAGNHGWDTINVTRTAPSWSRIYITSNSQFASQASSNGWPGDGTQPNPYLIFDYDINASLANGIDIRSTNVNFTISCCDITSITHNYTGIYFSGVINGSIEDTNIADCKYGIYVTSSSSNIDIVGGSISSCSSHATSIICDDIDITGLTSSSNGGNGIYLMSCDGVTVADCTVSSNGNNGIHLSGCTEAVISGGEVSSNSWRGIYVGGGNDTTISGTEVSSNSQDGIYLTSVSSVSTKNVTVTGVSSTSNVRNGIALVSCMHVTITGSNLSLNSNSAYSGIYVNALANASITITENDFWQNKYGLFIEGATGVIIYDNDFLSNTYQAYDGNGKWNSWSCNSTSSGNHWSNWTSPDNNYDGIVDNHFSIPGSSPNAIDWRPKVNECTP